ncbi:MAG: hypothetical protein JW860_14650 [Sedimentisphaerales bacterium]|nr:hypothetical protein [Sedimentisphaerales bacterium]
MRKGFMLVECIVAITILASVMVTLSALFKTLLSDIPRTYRTYQTHSTMQSMIRTLRSDLDRARSLPRTAGMEMVNGKVFFIELPEHTLAYRLYEDQIIRQTLNADPCSPDHFEQVWTVVRGHIDWQVWVKNDKGYAVEITTSVDPLSAQRPKRLLANSCVLFLNSNGKKENTYEPQNP